MDTNNWLNELFSCFDSLNKEISPGFHLIVSGTAHTKE